jgi:Rrf2 family protein
MVYLSTQGRGVLTSRQEIATKADIPTHFLAKIAQDLARANFIEIRQGARGGFVLTKNPAQITLLQVVETMIGEIYLNDCVARPSSCTISFDCAVHRVWMTAREQLRATLNKVTFDHLIHEKSCVPAIPVREMGTDLLDGTPADTHDKLQ